MLLVVVQSGNLLIENRVSISDDRIVCENSENMFQSHQVIPLGT